MITAGPSPYFGAAGGSACPSAATARWMPWRSPGRTAPIAGSVRSRASVSPDRSSSSGLRLSSSTWQITAVSSRFAAALVAPAGQHVADLPDGIVDRVAAEDAPGQRLAVEAADAVERGEPAQQVGIGEQVGAGVGADLPRP